MAVAAHAREYRMSMGWPAYRADDRERALALARSAIETGGDDPAVVSRAGVVLLQLGHQFDLSVATLERAVAINPVDPEALALAGFANVLAGRLEPARRFYERALELIPDGVRASDALTGLAHVYLSMGQYERAIEYGVRSLGSNPNFNPTYWMIISAHAFLGQMDEARRLMAALHALSPGTTIKSILRNGTAQSSPQHHKLIEGLRLAGFPEG